MQKMKFTTLFRCGCASGDNGSSGFLLEDKMESLKLQKFCGYIIYIKSVVATIFATFLFCSGIWHCSNINRINQNIEQIEDYTTNTIVGCSNLISSIVGFSYVLIALVISALAVLYLLHGRKMLYSKTYEKKLVIISLVVECICSCSLGEYMISSIFMGFRWEILFIITFLPILIGQSFYTIYLLIKSLEENKKELNA